MFNLFFKNRAKKTLEQKLVVQREMHHTRKQEMRSELAMRANIASKLKHYSVEEDTTISNFKLAEDEVERRLPGKSTSARSKDIWGQANPRETGYWKKENRNKRYKN